MCWRRKHYTTWKGKEEKDIRLLLQEQGHLQRVIFVCLQCWIKVYDNIVSHLNENGFVPRIHKNKNRRPGNAFNFEDLKNAVNFIQNYADEFGLPQPNVKNHGNLFVFLPSAGNKTLLHATYVKSCRETENRHVGLTTFKLL